LIDLQPVTISNFYRSMKDLPVQYLLMVKSRDEYVAILYRDAIVLIKDVIKNGFMTKLNS